MPLSPHRNVCTRMLCVTDQPSSVPVQWTDMQILQTNNVFTKTARRFKFKPTGLLKTTRLSSRTAQGSHIASTVSSTTATDTLSYPTQPTSM
ncbi:hypothetical protein DPMN_143006 [Dreissena polymorpha]|uniref:Uncharacterized protein n=1 Tax=Dreissena polymorpha TaxID=45954 RepID=A0A9D4JLA6_DREPO|nr:hypothetical protein DPMN_143006 [Dreissena polymorpha]